MRFEARDLKRNVHSVKAADTQPSPGDRLLAILGGWRSLGISGAPCSGPGTALAISRDTRDSGRGGDRGAIVLGLRTLNPLVGDGPDRIQRARTLCIVPVSCVVGALDVAAGALNPVSPLLVLISGAAAAFGGVSVLRVDDGASPAGPGYPAASGCPARDRPIPQLDCLWRNDSASSSSRFSALGCGSDGVQWRARF